MRGRVLRRRGRSGPQWLSSHPDPGNRSAYIAREAQMLRLVRGAHTSRDFEGIKRRFAALPPATSMGDRSTRSGG